MMKESVYTSGEYLRNNPSWHVEDSAWKAGHIINMLKRHQLSVKTICEIGCGAGEILSQLQQQLDSDCEFFGYEISPQAFELCLPKENDRLNFKLGDILEEEDVRFDLILLNDVVEHIEDYHNFLRGIKGKSRYKLFHIPLDISVINVLSNRPLVDSHKLHGHIHHFTKDWVLQLLGDVDYEVIDYHYTEKYWEQPDNILIPRLLRLPRKVLFVINQDLAARILGGCALMVLAE